MAYAVERRIARDPSRFGEGAIEGVASPEAANNASDQTAFIPTMTLGIPGSSTMAIMLGVFMIHGITPGPLLITDHPELFWGVVMIFWIGNLLLVILNLPLIGIWVYFLTIPYHLLYPAVLLFICIGVYSVNQNAFEVWTVLAFGIVGHLMRVLHFPVAPLILGFVLGPMMEVHLRRAMLMSRGDFATFIERPISASILVVTTGLILLAAWTAAHRAAAERRASICRKSDPNLVKDP
jgi:TctA family transporter